MARKKGVFNRVLNIIGLVDDEPQGYEENYDQGYTSSASAARPSTYVPPQQRPRTADTRSRTVVPGNSRYSSRDDYNEGYTVRRTERSYETEQNSAPVSRRSTEPRRDPAPAPRAAAPARTSQSASNAPAPRTGGAARTIMCPITELEECRDVIEILVENNIVLLMLDNMDPSLTQRAVDLLSGAAFALHATIKKASDRTYLIAPRTVMVSENDELGRRY